MASCTARADTRVVHGRTSEAYCGFMASLTTSTGWNMVSRFGQACAAHFVAACTARGDARVIHLRATKEAGGGFVTGFTGSRRDDMCGWFRFYIGEITTVTSRTACSDASVIHGGWYKSHG